MSAPKSFATSARRAAGMKKTMEFTIRHDPEDGGQVIEYAFTANTPTEDQLIMFALIDFEDDDEVAHNLRMLFDFLGGILGADGRRRLEKMLAAGHVTMADLVQGEGSVLGWIIEQWGDFPTQPQSDSSPTPGRTGGRSTGRQRRPALTPSSSPSTDS